MKSQGIFNFLMSGNPEEIAKKGWSYNTGSLIGTQCNGT